MNGRFVSPSEVEGRSGRIGLLDMIARSALLALFEKIEQGELIVNDRGEIHRFGRPAVGFESPVRVTVNDAGLWGDLAFGGSIGSGESYMQRLWDCDDLTGLIRLFLRNRHVLHRVDGGLARLTRPLNKIVHALRHNNRKGSRRNISAHYDLGNEMFSLFLDKTMMYSCGIFEHESATMKEASETKLDRICKKLELGPDDHVLEIGTGWGGFAVHAAGHYGCRVTTTTISREQFDYARRLVREKGLEHRVTLLLQDYRDLAGEYDKLVSIEMIEAVGHRYMDTYFEKCSSLLKPDGAMLLQAITIADQHYEQAKRSVDFIQKYIFPGGFIPSITAMSDSIARKTDLRLFHMEDIGPHYASTLRRWRERFFENIERVRALGYPESFVRMWEYYLCYSEGGFEERAIGNAHLLLTKPRCRLPALVPNLARAGRRADAPRRWLESA